jgi:16S rRNA C967 or C1407 C5-methylase (RsmB/RsmF family)
MEALPPDMKVGSRGYGYEAAVRFHPHLHDTPGFFIVRLMRVH